ncbi:MAG: metallophosphoesterase [Vicinamibacterales bacterium]
MSKIFGTLLILLAVGLRPFAAPTLTVPNRPNTLKFAVLGDNGSGDSGQYELATQIAAVYRLFAFGFVVMVGDNFYGKQTPADLANKFDVPYRPLLDSGVTFHAAIGNHDEVFTVNYPPLNMSGRRYYTYVRQQVRFFVLDTNIMDAPQLRWFESVLQQSQEPWKIAYFHHPLYGNAKRHGSTVDIRILLEPLLVKYGVAVVFTGHDHVYERLKPQKGVHYFVTGSGGQLRKGDLVPSETTAAGFDQDQAFMIVEVDADTLFFQTISRTGATVDAGTIPRRLRHDGTR